MAFLMLELKGMLAFLSQMDEMQIEVDLGSQGVDIDSVVVAKAGSDLADFFSKSSKLRPPLASFHRKGGYLTGTFALDPGLYSRLFNGLLENFSQDPAMAKFFTPEFSSLLRTMSDAWKGTGTMSARPSEKLFEIDYVMGIKDEEKLIEMMELSAALFKPGSGRQAYP